MSWLTSLFRTDGSIQWAPLDEQVAAMDPFKLPAVVAGRQLLADTVATFTLHAIDVDTGRELERNRRIYVRPDPARGEPLRNTLERLVNAQTRYGTGITRVTARSMLTGGATGAGFPIALEFIANRRVTFTMSANGQQIDTMTIDGRAQNVADIYLFPFVLNDLGGPLGCAPLDLIQDALESLRQALVWYRDFYGAGSTPPYAIIHKSRLTDDKAEKYMTAWAAQRIKRRPALLSGEVELQAFNPTNAVDAQLLEAIRYFDAAVARVLQIPPSLLNVVTEDPSTYANVRDEFRRWLALGLNPGFVNRIEAGFAEMAPQGTGCRMRTDQLVRMDTADRVQVAGNGLASGVLSEDQAQQLATGGPAPQQTPGRVTT